MKRSQAIRLISYLVKAGKIMNSDEMDTAERIMLEVENIIRMEPIKEWKPEDE